MKVKCWMKSAIPVVILNNFMTESVRVSVGVGLRHVSSPKTLFDVCKCALGMSNNMP